MLAQHWGRRFRIWWGGRGGAYRWLVSFHGVCGAGGGGGGAWSVGQRCVEPHEGAHFGPQLGNVPSSHSCDPVRCCRLACLQAIHQNTTSPRPIRASLPSISISTTIYTASLRAASASVTSVRVQPFCARRSVSAGFFGGFQAPHYERSSLRAICRFLRSDKRASGPVMSSLSPSASRTQSSYGWCVG